MTRTLTAAAIAAALLAGGCGSSKHHYSEQTVQTVTLGCVSAAEKAGASPDRASSYCACVITHLERHVSVEEFSAVAARFQLGDSTIPHDWQPDIEACR